MTQDYPSFLDDAAVFNFVLTESGDKRPVAPYSQGHIYGASWKDNAKEARTDIETALEYADLSTYDVRRMAYPDGLVPVTLGVGYPIPPEDEQDPSESPTLIDFDDARDPDTGALHPEAIEVVERADSYTQVSSSGCGIHVIVRGALPDGVGTVDGDLEETSQFPDAHVEVYDRDRFIAMTFNRLDGSPEELRHTPDLLSDLADEYDTSASGGDGFDPEEHEPTFSEEHISSVEETSNIEEIFDALSHANGSHAVQKVRSEVTEDRGNGTYSLDPTWAISESGTRLAYDDGGFIYRKGDVGMSTLQVVGMEERILTSEDEYPTGDTFWECVDAMRSRGFDIPEYVGKKEAINWATILPDTQIEAQEPAVTREDHHAVVETEISQAMQNERFILADAIMSGGKTFSSFKAAHNLDEPMAYFAPRVDLYEQAKEYAMEVGFSESEIFLAPSIKRHCPTFNGEHGTEWERRVKGQYYAGVSPKRIHTDNTDIPCSHGDGDDHTCPYEDRWAEFDADQHAVVIGHHTHAHLPILTKHRHVVIDEDPGDSFTTRLSGEQLINAVQAFADMDGSPPFNGWHDLLEARHDRKRRNRILGWFDNYDLEPDEDNAIAAWEDGYHAYAPHAVYTILKSDDGEFSRSYLSDIDTQGLFHAPNRYGDEYAVEVRTTPNISYAESIIALDGTPLTVKDDDVQVVSEVPEWSAAIGEELEHVKILTDEERARYLRNTLGHHYIQTAGGIKPYSSGRHNNPLEDQALLKAATDKYGGGTPPVVVTSKTVCEQYEDAGFRRDGIVETFEYPGNLRGTNKYADTRFAVQLGSSHHGDYEIARRAAWLGADIDPDGRGHNREYGSTVGDKILKQMREQQTLQNILRFGRDGGGATILLHTGAFPDWLPVEGQGTVDPWSDGMRQVHEAWQDLSVSTGTSLTVSDIHDHEAVSVTKTRARSILHRFETELNLIDRRDDPDDGRQYLWSDRGLRDIEHLETADYDLPSLSDSQKEAVGLVDDDGELKVEETQISRYATNTSNLRIYPDLSPAIDQKDSETGGGDDPPGGGGAERGS